jgi:predicted dehydrogenase
MPQAKGAGSSMPEQIRVGVVGTSGWTERVHIGGLLSHPGATLAAICGQHSERTAALAARYSIPRAYTDFRQMIAEADLTALIVATPDDLHYACTMAALDAGMHVLCEKPLAGTAQEAHAMYRAAEEAGVVHMTMFTYRWLPIYRYLRSLIDAGYAGSILDYEMEWSSSYGLGSAYNWRFDAARANGVLGDFGSHLIDLAGLYFGAIGAVRAELSTSVERRDGAGMLVAGANDVATVELTFRSGVHGLLRLSAVARVGEADYRQRIVLRGASGSLEAQLSPLGAMVLGKQGAEMHSTALPIPGDYWRGIVRDDSYDALIAQQAGARLFVDAINNRENPTPSFYDGWKAQEVVDAAFQSAHDGSVVPLPAE